MKVVWEVSKKRKLKEYVNKVDVRLEKKNMK
jgi:hypothetical protein